MRIRETTSFPHPILSVYTPDYEKGSFLLELDNVEENVQGGTVLLEGRILLQEKNLEQLVLNGKARTGLMITCQSTYLDLWHEVDSAAFKLELGDGCLRNTVYVQALIVAAEDFYLPEAGLAGRFNEYSRYIRAGNPIAVSVENQLETGFDKLVTMESIFSLSPDESVCEDMFVVDTDSETIDIKAGIKLFEDIQRLRASLSKPILLSALYLPVMMEVLEIMRDGSFSDRRWNRVIRAKCSASGITIDRNMSIAEVAQKLMNSPLGFLAGAVESTK